MLDRSNSHFRLEGRWFRCLRSRILFQLARCRWIPYRRFWTLVTSTNIQETAVYDADGGIATHITSKVWDPNVMFVANSSPSNKLIKVVLFPVGISIPRNLAALLALDPTEDFFARVRTFSETAISLARLKAGAFVVVILVFGLRGRRRAEVRGRIGRTARVERTENNMIDDFCDLKDADTHGTKATKLLVNTTYISAFIPVPYMMYSI
jgi:hypothetical protein